jgi:hypothetical protein
MPPSKRHGRANIRRRDPLGDGALVEALACFLSARRLAEISIHAIVIDVVVIDVDGPRVSAHS